MVATEKVRDCYKDIINNLKKKNIYKVYGSCNNGINSIKYILKYKVSITNIKSTKEVSSSSSYMMLEQVYKIGYAQKEKEMTNRFEK